MAVKRKYGYYPDNFELQSFCAKYKLPANKVVSILDLFINKPIGQKDEQWIVLNSTLLRKLVGNIYKDIIVALTDYKVIEVNRSYKVGEYSMSYKLLDKYQFANELSKYPLVGGHLNVSLAKTNNRKIFKRYLEDLKLSKIKRRTELPEIIFNTKYRILIHWFKTNKLVIDKDKAVKLLHEKNFKENEPNKYLSYLAAIKMIEDKNYYLKSDRNGRFYSSITNLPKALRSCLSYDGEELVGTDVSNTQPLLLGELCDSVKLNQLKHSKNIIVNELMFNKFINHLNDYPSDLLEYKTLVQDGKLYESFIGIAPNFDRDVVKANMVKIINDRGYNDIKEKKILREALKQKFPTISMLLDLLKSVDHHYSSSTLMSLESWNFVQYFPEIFSYKEANQNIPLFTIHDCFFTTKSKIDYLESEIEAFFQNNLMIHIPLKREVYD